jgi:iron complex transport system substrate-binding protein
MRFFSAGLLGMLGAAGALTGCGGATEAAGGGIVSLGPHLTEAIFAMGEGHRLVGRGDYDDYPAEVLELESVGGYLDPNLERIALLQPELIVLPGEHRKVAEFAQLNVIPALPVHMDSFATIEAGITELGGALGVPDKADALNRKMQAQSEALRARLAGVQRPRVLIVTQRDSADLSTIYTAGGPSFVSEMVALAGGENIFADTDQAYFAASKESVVTAAPEIILEFHAGQSMTERQRQRYIDDWQALRELPAVTNYRVYLVEESFALRPGPRVVDMAERIARRLHPDLEWGP